MCPLPLYVPQEMLTSCLSTHSAQEESVQLEMDLLSLHSQLYQLETRQSHLTSSPDNTDEGTLLQLVMEISSLQQQACHVTSHDLSHDPGPPLD